MKSAIVVPRTIGQKGPSDLSQSFKRSGVVSWQPSRGLDWQIPPGHSFFDGGITGLFSGSSVEEKVSVLRAWD